MFKNIYTLYIPYISFIYPLYILFPRNFLISFIFFLTNSHQIFLWIYNGSSRKILIGPQLWTHQADRFGKWSFILQVMKIGLSIPNDVEKSYWFSTFLYHQAFSDVFTSLPQYYIEMLMWKSLMFFHKVVHRFMDYRDQHIFLSTHEKKIFSQVSR